jgi:hypothetical protein
MSDDLCPQKSKWLLISILLLVTNSFAIPYCIK